MPFQFPVNPTAGQTFNPVPGVSYKWDGFGWVPSSANVIPDAPMDSGIYGRSNGAWVNIFSYIYAVGDIHISMNGANPAARFGGTWALISQGSFLIGAAAGLVSGSTGGASSVTLAQSNLPAITLTGVTDNASVNHAHTYTDTYHDGTIEAPSIDVTAITGYGSTPIPHSATTGGMTGNDPHSHNVSVPLGGGNQPISTVPPFFAVYVWQRTA